MHSLILRFRARAVTTAVLIVMNTQTIAALADTLNGPLARLPQPEINSDKAADDCFQQGIRLINSGKREDAIDQFKRAVQIKSDFANAWYNLGELYAATGNLKEARNSLKTYLGLVPAGSRADFAKALLKYLDTMASRTVESNSASNYLNELHSDEIARWPASRSCLKVFILPGNNIPGYKPEYKKELIDAFQSWSKASGGIISFSYVDDFKSFRSMDDFKNGDIVVGWSNDAKNIISFKNESGECRLTLEKGTREIKRAFILLLTNAPYVEMSPIQAWNLSLHEIGHALGIYGHSNNPDDVMYFFGWPDRQRHSLSNRDVQTLRRLYAKDRLD